MPNTVCKVSIDVRSTAVIAANVNMMTRDDHISVYVVPEFAFGTNKSNIMTTADMVDSDSTLEKEGEPVIVRISLTSGR